MTEQPSATTPSVEDQQAAEQAVQGEQVAGTTEQQAQPADEQAQPTQTGNAADEGGEPAA